MQPDLFAAAVTKYFPAPATGSAQADDDKQADEAGNQLVFIGVFNNELVQDMASKAAWPTSSNPDKNPRPTLSMSQRLASLLCDFNHLVKSRCNCLSILNS